MENKALTKHAAAVAAGTMLSRVLGYIRDMLVANFFGAGIFADAFYAAFRIPNLFRRMLGEGSFCAAFIPVFSQYLHTKEKSATQEMLNAVFSALLILLLIVCALGMFFSPWLVKIIVWGFTNDPDKLNLTIELTRLMFPFVLFICLAAFLLAILNTLYSFFLPAVAPASLSVAEILYMLCVLPLIVFEQNQIKGLALAVIAGGLLHFGLQYPLLKKLGWKLKFKLNLKHPAIKKIAFLMIPSIIGLSVDQINAFVDNICASFLESGSITALYYSNRVMQLPLAIFGLALATVSLPAMSKAASLKDIKTLNNSLNFSIKLSVFAMLPAAAGLMAVGLPIVKLLFERGRFDAYASLITNKALFYYSLGLPAYAITKLLANAFYSFCDTKTPVVTACASMVLHVILCIVLMYPMQTGGLALATSLSAYFNLILLAVFLRKKRPEIKSLNVWTSIIKSLIAALLAGVISFFVYAQLSAHLFIGVAASIISACLVFVAAAFLMKSEELQIFIDVIKRKIGWAKKPN
ncbi:MAG: murein biosynthesis integral membrane protein MurJ [Elusimicrobiota bacterium]|jgi:putative peptidoglycan lipid II flippase|nr:murein biosynthesis integral membrane protein MurJ [Elusimicrobiota bacterium]